MHLFGLNGKKSSFVLPAVALMLCWGVNTSLATDSFENEVASFARIKGDNDIAAEKKRMHFIKSNRYLIAKLQEQKAIFIKIRGSRKNKVSIKTEKLINEASLLASQGSYEEGIEILVQAYGVVTTSINEMSVE